jgi:hypothetical protein
MPVSFNGFVQSTNANSVQKREIGIEQHPMASNEKNRVLNSFG